MKSRDENSPAYDLRAEAREGGEVGVPDRRSGETASGALIALAALLEKMAGQAGEWAAQMSGVLVRCYRSGGKVLCCGNGGSATQADHAAAELAGRFYRNRKALPALSLSDNVASLTAVANDLGYETVFSRQIEGLGRPGDVLLAFSTSGESPNILEAVKKAREMGLVIIGFTGERGTQFAGQCDHCLIVPTSDSARIQEVHLAVAHSVCALTEAALFERR
jgi:D-sedoheptulose 7-phosphate isomerase